MLGKALGRRGILRGIAGAGVVAAAPSNVVTGMVSPRADYAYPPPSPVNSVGSGYREWPDWLKALDRETDDKVDAIRDRPSVDGFDVDLYVLQSMSLSAKLGEQRRRDRARRKEAQTLRDRFHDMRRKFEDGLLGQLGLKP